MFLISSALILHSKAACITDGSEVLWEQQQNHQPHGVMFHVRSQTGLIPLSCANSPNMTCGLKANNVGAQLTVIACVCSSSCTRSRLPQSPADKQGSHSTLRRKQSSEWAGCSRRSGTKWTPHFDTWNRGGRTKSNYGEQLCSTSPMKQHKDIF